MFFALLCLIILALLGSGHAPDQFGWMMLVGVAWLAGYFDCRKFSKSDQDAKRVMPPDIKEPSNNFEP